MVELALIISVVVIGPAVLVVLYVRGRARATRNPEVEAAYRAAGFIVSTSRLHGGLEVRGTLTGMPFELRANPGSRYQTPFVMVSVPSTLAREFTLTREGSQDLSGGDLVESTFPDAKSREAVRALFGLGFETVAHGRGSLSAIRHFKPAPPEPGALRAVIEQLAVLCAMPGPRSEAAKPVSALGQTLLGLGGGVLLLGGFALALVADRATHSLTEGMPAQVWLAAAVACIALTVLAQRLLRGRPNAGTLLFAFIGLVLPSLAAAAWGAAMLVNEHFDQSAARERPAEGGLPERIRRGSEYRYFVDIGPLREGGPRTTIEVSGAHRNAKAGQRWIVRTRAGRLGFEWVESARPAPER